MAWISALAIGALALLIALGVGFTLRRRKRIGEPEVVASPVEEPQTTTSVVHPADLALLEQQAIEAEIAGDCERAAQLFETAGMLQRALEQYRRAGNIQKAAELELLSMELGRLSQNFDVIGAEPAPSPFANGFSRGEVASDDMVASDDVHTHPTLPPRNNSIPAQALPSIIPTVAPTPVFSTLPPSQGPDASTYPPRASATSTVPPQRASSAPPEKRASLFPSFRRKSSTASEKRSLFPSFKREKSEPPAKAPALPLAAPPSERPKPRMPTVEELERMLGPNPTPDLGNIEIYYRLGLVHLAAGATERAREAFATVEEISPGYRDAEAYLEKLAPPAVRTFKRTPANDNVASPADGTAQPQARPRARRAIVEEVRIAGSRRDDR